MPLLFQGNNISDSAFDKACWHVPGGLNLPPAPSGGAKTFPCCCQINDFPAVSSETYDLLFLRRIMIMLSELIPIETSSKVSVNPKRIYMAGHSNGCIASLSMAKIHSDVVAAVCCTGGVSVTAAPDNYIPTPQFTVRGMIHNIAFKAKWD
jgi:poly(3-hydroxybutyrate) depolymerase